MSRLMRYAILPAVFVLLLFAGWRVVGQMQAERHAQTEPERALRWRPNHPGALLVLAERQLAKGDTSAAQATTRRLLAHEPLQGEAFRVLAEAADRQGRRAEAFRLYRIAEHRAPRDLQTRAWLTQRYLELGEYPQALAQIDRILRMSPQRARSIHPLLVRLAQDPRFAEALARALASGPPWRPGMLEALRDPKAGNPVAAGRVMQALQDQGGLSPVEYANWLDSLIAQGRWGEAYARWAGAVAKPGDRLPQAYNGDFAARPSGSGFDWRLGRVPGVLLEFESAAGSSGQAAYLRFLDRRVPNAQDWSSRCCCRRATIGSTLSMRAQSPCAARSACNGSLPAQERAGEVARTRIDRWQLRLGVRIRGGLPDPVQQDARGNG
jgi:tetratricopeptide (TPR) repeat protein